jgi:adenylate kinase family enzyme
VRGRERIHVVGASGSGTTSLAAAVARTLGVPHFDTDEFYWVKTNPPFREKRPIPERLELLGRALDEAGDSWVLSGSLAGWGDPLVPRFDLVVFLTLDRDVRMARLRAREVIRYGAARVRAGGDLAEATEDFLAWAARYDDAGPEQRSRVGHEAWLALLPCPVLRLDSSAPIEELCRQVIDASDG